MAQAITRIGIVGCGNICGIYFKNAAWLENVEITRCTDLVADKAAAVASEHGCQSCGTQELLEADDVDVVLNLTIPKAHYSVAKAALEAGKHVYNEKPLAMDRKEARELMDLAAKRDLRIGCAPDTFLGAGLQTCREIIDRGDIGEPIGATAFMGCPGHESWHPDPDFYYKPGGGPMLDMGPYYMTALVSLLGPIRRVAGVTRRGRDPRRIGSGPREGEKIDVEVPTHITGLLDFDCGTAATIVTSFDVWGHNCPRIEIYGTEGSLNCGDPNMFFGPVKLKRGGDDWQDVELSRPYTENSRCLGVADMGAAIEADRPHRCNAQLAFHVLDAMLAIYDSSDSSEHVRLTSTVERPAPLPADLEKGKID
jgi:predicted dehydrogenase